MIALGKTRDGQLTSHYVLLSQAVAVQMEFVEADALEENQHVAAAGDKRCEEIVGLEFVVVVDAFQRVFYTVCIAVDDEDAAVIHLQPDILSLVNDNSIHTIV